jgi:hypothetical protein
MLLGLADLEHLQNPMLVVNFGIPSLAVLESRDQFNRIVERFELIAHTEDRQFMP